MDSGRARNLELPAYIGGIQNARLGHAPNKCLDPFHAYAHEHARFRPFHRHVSKFRFAVLRRALFVEGPASRATNRTVAGGHPDTKRSNTEPGRSGISRSSPQHHDVDGYEAALMAALVE